MREGIFFSRPSHYLYCNSSFNGTLILLVNYLLILLFLLCPHLGGIESLVGLLDSELEHVLVNCVNALRVLCDGNHDNQTAVAKSGAIDTLTELLSE